MKIALALLLAFGLNSIALAQDHYQVLRRQVQLWSGPNDDMRPEIAGTVVSVDSSGVTLAGGAHVPVTHAKVRKGQQATFVCESIDEQQPPSMKACTLEHAETPPPANPKGEVKLW